MYHMNIMSVLYTAQWAKSLSKWLNCSYSSWLFLFCVHDLVYGGGLNSPWQARTEEMVFIATLVAIVDVSRKNSENILELVKALVGHGVGSAKG